jgi:hypothetical protein
VIVCGAKMAEELLVDLPAICSARMPVFTRNQTQHRQSAGEIAPAATVRAENDGYVSFLLTWAAGRWWSHQSDL